MDAKTETSLERLVSLVSDHGVDGIEKWRDERKAQQLNEANRVRESSVYYVGELGTALIRGLNDGVREVETVVGRYIMTYDELPIFAKKNGIDWRELQDVCELRQASVSARGKTFVAGKGQYIDRSQSKRDHEEAYIEDAKSYARVQARNEAIRGVPSSLPMQAPIKEWKN